MKLEPTEAEALLIPPLSGLRNARRLLRVVDQHIRARDLNAALELVDPLVLGEGLGLTQGEIASLTKGAQKLRDRRHARKRDPRTP